jgi:hypothetical protein
MKHDKNSLKPSTNAPNPAKFLKEMEALVPKLKAKGIIPMNRDEARALGERGTKAAAAKAEAEHQRRLDIIGRRIDEYMSQLSPLAFRLVQVMRWGWLLRALGYSYQVIPQNETVEGIADVPCTRIYVHRKWFPFFIKKTVKAERLVWEEPKKPKSRIIMP